MASRVYLDVLAHLRARVSGAAPIIASSLCARKARLERLIEALLEGAAPGAGCPWRYAREPGWPPLPSTSRAGAGRPYPPRPT